MTAAGSNTYEYDANGNMTGRTVAGTTYTLTYDYENRLTGVSGGGASYTFVYDGDGNRVKLIAPSDTILYIGGYLEKTSTNEKIYYYEGGARVSMRTAGAAYFLLTDQLGSSTVALTSTGSQYGRLLYHPWGSVRYTTGSVPTSYRYTGQIEYATIAGGIMYYGARYYDNSLGRCH